MKTRIRTEDLAALTPEQRALFETLLRKQKLEKALPTASEEEAEAPDLEPIPPRSHEKDTWPLSTDQERLWLVYQVAPESPAYNIYHPMWLRSKDGSTLNFAVLQKVLEEVARRHAIWRTIFPEVDGRGVQVIQPPGEIPLPVVDLRGVYRPGLEPMVQRLVQLDALRPFDLANGPVVRTGMLWLGESEYVYLITVHHIITDWITWATFWREFGLLYEAFSQGRPSPLPEPPIQYSDYAVWQRDFIARGGLKKHQDYWQQHLADASMILELPTDRPRPAVQDMVGTRSRLRLDPRLSERLREFSRRENATSFMTLMALFKLLLRRYAGQDDVIMSSPSANRDRPEIETILGFFLNQVVFYTRISGDPTFLELVRQVRRVAIDAYEHQALPFYQLLDEVNPPRDPSRAPIAQVSFFILEMAESGGIPGFEVSGPDPDVGTARNDLELYFWDHPKDGFWGWLEYNTDLFDATTVHRFGQNLKALVQAAMDHPEAHVSALSSLAPEQRQQVLVEWNGGRMDNLGPAPLPLLFAAQVERSPQAVAIELSSASFTYACLDLWANRLAEHLRSLGVGPESSVAVCLERSFELAVALFGILKAGGAYVPLDPDYPVARLAYMLQDSAAQVLLTAEPMKERLPEEGLPRTVWLDRERTLFANRSGQPPEVAWHLDHPAYTIYTSGSTGRPKGVTNSHRGIANRLLWMYSTHPLSDADAMMQKSPLSFDISVWEIFWSLSKGARLVMAIPGGHRDPEYLARWVSESRVTVMHFVPSMLRIFLDQPDLPPCRTLKWVVTTGEVLGPDLVTRFQDRYQATLFNFYGPTEAAVEVTWWACGREDRDANLVPIGRPVANAQIYVLGRDGRPVPQGVPGELCIGGVQVARGYYGKPALTAKAFVPSPYGRGERLYRTGDLACFRRDGRIDYLGRLDFQVKVRGFRIEVGEIEAILVSHPAIREAGVVTQHSAAASQRLIAYLQSDGDQVVPNDAELRSFLAASLPEYMVPAVFVTLPDLPRTPSGKLDRGTLGRRALPSSVLSDDGQDGSYVAPRSEAEKQIAGIWSDLLGRERIGVHDMFLELGGDSILGMQVVSRARALGLRLAPRQIFEYPTVAELAAAAGNLDGIHAEQGVVTGSVPLTPIQQWFFEQNQPDPHHWNFGEVLRVGRSLEPAHLQAVTAHLLRHHDALRLRFQEDGGVVKQHLGVVDQEVPYHRCNLTGLPDGEGVGALRRAAEQAQGSLDLGGRVFRVVHFSLDDGLGDRLLLVVHHLVMDAMSWRILLEDLEACLAQLDRGEPMALPAKTTSIKAWAESLHRLAQKPALAEELPYWLATGDASPSRLPRDVPGVESLEAFSSHVYARLGKEETAILLEELPVLYRAQIEVALVTALAMALAEWSGERRQWVELEGHGREETEAGIDVSRTVGWFTSIFPLGLDLRDRETPRECLLAVKEAMHNLPQGGFGYGLLRYLKSEGEGVRELRSQAPAEVVFNYLGQHQEAADEGPKEGDGELGDALMSGRARRSHLLEFGAIIQGGELEISIGYGADVHRRTTMEALAEGYRRALARLAEHCKEADAGGFTPSDFPLTQLGQAELDGLLGRDLGVEDVYPLSPMQEGMLFHSLYEAGSDVYVMQMVFTLTDGTDGQGWDLKLIGEAWDEVVQRHIGLRTAFVVDVPGRPLQIVRRRVEVPWHREDWRELDSAEQEQRLEALLEEDRNRSFDVAEAPLMRMFLLQTAEGTWRWVWSFHHLLLDGWSLPLVLGQVFEVYRARSQGNQPQVDSTLRPYRDYISWLQHQDLSQAEAWWRRTLRGLQAPNPLDLGAVDSSSTLAYGLERRDLSPQASERLRGLCQRLQVTPNTVLGGAWALLLSRYGVGEDVVFGVTVSGRPAELPGVEEMVGLFLNTLPTRVAIEPARQVGPWLRDLQAHQVEMRQFEFSPLHQVQELGDLPAGQPLFETLLVFENFPEADFSTVGAGAGETGMPSIQEDQAIEQAHYPITLTAALDSRLELQLNYQTERFRVTAMRRMLRHLEGILAAISEREESCLGDLSWIDRTERHQVLVEWNERVEDLAWGQDRREDPRESCNVLTLFSEQAAHRPHAPAVLGRGRTWSYGELLEESKALAARLRAVGVGPEMFVGLFVERCAEMAVGILGVLEAGAAFLPLDPAYPEQRLAYMLADSGVALVLTQESLVNRLPGEVQTLLLDASQEEAFGKVESSFPRATTGPNHAAYAIYTSGSTGAPKAVVVEHRSLAQYSLEMARQFALGSEDRVLQFSSVSFDVLEEELFPTWVSGGCVVLEDPETLSTPQGVQVAIEEHQITWLELPAAFWHTWMEELAGEGAAPPARPSTSLRFLIVGSERLQPRWVEAWRQHGVPLVYIFGLTETTITTSFHRVEGSLGGGAELPIGRPLPASSMHVLGSGFEPRPIGLTGELFIGGEGVARGYLGRPGLTAERFIPDPFAETPGRRLYRTGDRARLRARGELDFLGRLDDQLKIRGFRIEPREVVVLLEEHPHVEQAVVAGWRPKEDRGQGDASLRLVAWVQAVEGREFQVSELRQFLGQQLPEYMVPARFVPVDSFPLTPNGKVDRNALQQELQGDEVQALGPEASWEAPKGEVEEQLASIWTDVLGVERPGRHDNFFEVGGDSILSLQIASRARREFLNVTPRQIFEQPTLAELAAVVTVAEGALEVHQPKIGETPLLPLHGWFFEQELAAPNHFNMPLLLVLKKRFDPRWLPSILAALALQHDALRQRFRQRDGAWLQDFLPLDAAPPVGLTLNLTALPKERQADAFGAAAEALQGSLDLSAGPLFRALLGEWTEGGQRLFLAAHHLLVDTVSWRVLVEDFALAWQQLQAGKAIDLPLHSTSPGVWAEALAAWAEGPDAVAEAKFWQPPTDDLPRLPKALAEDPGDDAEGSTESLVVRLEEESTAGLLNEVPKAYRNQVQEALLTALTLAVGEMTGEPRLLVDLEGHGREAPVPEMDLGRTVGWLAVIYPLLLDLRPACVESASTSHAVDLGRALGIAKQTVQSVPRGGLTFGAVRTLGQGEEAQRLRTWPRPQILWNYHGQIDQGVGDGDLPFTLGGDAVGAEVAAENARSHDLAIDVNILGGCLEAEFTWGRHRHSRAMVESLAAKFLDALRELIEHCRDPRQWTLTPADFPLLNIDQASLSRLARRPHGVEEIYPLTPMQAGMLFHCLGEPGQGLYVAQYEHEIRGPLDVERFQNAWRRVLRHHGALRTSMAWEGLDEMVQVVHRDGHFSWQIEDWRELTPAQREGRRADFLEEDRKRGFDPAQAPLMRHAVLRFEEGVWRYVLTFQQLLFDGWSLPILLRDVFSCYQAGEGYSLPETAPYGDYIAWLRSQDLAAEESFWRPRLAGLTTPSRLRSARPETVPAAQRFGEKELTLPRPLEGELSALARHLRVTPNTLFQAAWALLLWRWGNGRRVLFGVTVSGRPTEVPRVEEMVGMMLNTLPLTPEVEPRSQLGPWLRALQEQAVELRQHEVTPLVQIQKWSEVPAEEPLFESYLVYQNLPMAEALEQPELELAIDVVHTAERGSDAIALSVLPGDEGIDLRLEHDRGLLDDEGARCVLDHLQRLLKSMVKAPQSRLEALSMLSDEERRQLLVEWQGEPSATAVETIHGLFERSAARRPTAPALVWDEGRWNFEELDQRANRLAHYLMSLGGGPETAVGLCLHRSPQLMVSLLAVLKAGGTYVPLDPSYPVARLTFMMEDAGLSLLITNGNPIPGLTESTTARQVDLASEAAEIAAQDDSPPTLPISPAQAAYVLYTSGSTGQPKGVVVSHRAVAGYAEEARDQFRLSPEDRMLQFASISFDVMVEEIFPAWAAGASVALSSEELFPSAEELTERIERLGVTGLELPAAYWHAWVEHLNSLESTGIPLPPSLRLVLVGCDKPRAERLEEWRRLGLELHYVFGLTETTITSAHYRLGTSPWEPDLPIGRCWRGAKLYVLEEEDGLKPCAVGVSGELYVGGGGLARGYLNQARLTAERFLPDPFSRQKGARLYRTGDRARFLPDGHLDFLGRMDEQLKVRGFRVEPGEVAAALSAVEGVSAAVVVPVTGSGEVRLAAYVVAGGAAASQEVLRRHLEDRLPDYMVPASLNYLDSLPLTPNGKVDTEALPAPQGERRVRDAEYVAPRTRREEQLAAVWAEVLGIPRVGVVESFFDLGGDSILSLQIISRARAAGLHLTPRQLFEHPTVEGLARVAGESSKVFAEQALVTGAMPLLPIQHWFFEQDLTSPEHWNESRFLQVREPLDMSALGAALGDILAHHDALRLRFPGGAEAVFATPGKPPLSVVDLSSISHADSTATLEKAAARAQRSLHLEHGPMVRLVVFHLGAERSERLLLLFHHLVVDAISIQIVLQDLQRAYGRRRSGQPPELPAKTSSFAAWGKRLTAFSAQLTTAEGDTWRRFAEGGEEAIPVDFPAGENRILDTDAVEFSLGVELTGALLREVPKAYRTQVNEVLLACLGEAWRVWSGQNRLLLTLEGHGREDLFEDLDLSRTVGFFTTHYPVLVEVPEEGDWGAALKWMKERLRAIPQHGLGYGLLRYLSPDEDLRRALAWDAAVYFEYLGQQEEAAILEENSPFRAAKEWGGATESSLGKRPFALEISGEVVAGELCFSISYSRGLHRREAIEGLASSYAEALQGAIEHCLAPESGGVTPSDFPQANLDSSSLEALVGNGRGVEDVYSLSPLQSGMLFDTLADPQAGLYVAQYEYEFEGRLDVQLFQAAWARVLAHHSALRTSFAWEGLEEMVQVVHREVAAEWQVEDWKGVSASEFSARRQEFLQRDRARGLDVSKAPLVRHCLWHLDERRAHYICTFHQLLFDGWSLPMVLEAVFAAYQGGPSAALPPSPPFREYIAWLQRQDPMATEVFWRRQLQGFTAPSRLRAGRQQVDALPAEERFGAQESFLSTAQADAIAAFSRRLRITTNTCFQAAWALLLWRYGSGRRVLFGMTVSGRPTDLPGVEEMVGMMLNTLPLAVEIKPTTSLRSWLGALQEQTVELRQYESTPLVQIQKWSEVPAEDPLFESFLSYNNYPIEETLEAASESAADLVVRPVDTIERGGEAIALSVTPGEGFAVKLENNRTLLDDTAAQRVLVHYGRLLDGLASSEEALVGDLSLLSPSERQQLLVTWQGAALDFESEILHGLFERSALERPEDPALVWDEGSWSFLELDAKANRLAHHLRHLGVASEVRVGLCMERTPELIVCLLAVLKAGGAYVPLDPSYPASRLRYLVEDSGLALLLTQSALVSGLEEMATAARIVDLAAEESVIAACDSSSLSLRVSPQQAAYILYTSGSTGLPKGVVISHGAVCQYAEEARRQFDLRPADRVLQFASISFDVMVEELFPIWAAGGSVALSGAELFPSAEELTDRIARLEVTGLELPAAYWHAWVEHLMSLPAPPSSLRFVLVGCDKPQPERLADWQSLGLDLHYVFGLTETTITSSHYQLGTSSWEPDLPVGRCWRGTTLYVLREDLLEPCAAGVSGELYIGGAGLARGYLNRAKQTAERFIPNPYASEVGARLYRTGDRARFLADGHVDFLGRLDEQLKIRGFRVEPGEVAAVLGACEGVSAAVVVPKTRRSEVRLAAYVVANRAEVSQENLLAQLRDRLPEYMLPSSLVILETIPLTPNGKVDTEALPEPQWDRVSAEAGYLAPRTQPEMALAAVWAEVLGVPRVGVRESFFDLGGDSILSLQIISRARAAGLYLTPRQLFEHPTVEDLARVASESSTVSAEQGLVTGSMPLLPIQRWFFEQDLSSPEHWNEARFLKVQERLDVASLRAALQDVLAHHDALRLRFSGGVESSFGELGEPPLSLLELSRVPEAAITAAVEDAAAKAQRSLNLERGPMVRLVAFNLGEKRSGRLLLLFHHLVVDAISVQTVLEDLQQAYGRRRAKKATALPPKTSSFAAWGRRLMTLSEDLGAVQGAWWRDLLSRQPAALPVDFPGGENRVLDLDTVEFSLGAERTQALLREVPQAYRTQVNEVLLACLGAAWRVWSGQERLLLTLEGHGREDLFDDLDLSRTVGFFTTHYPVLVEASKGGDWGSALKSMKESLRQIPHHGLGYGVLRYLSEDKELQQALAWKSEVYFEYLGQQEEASLLAEDSPFTGAEEWSGATESPLGKRPFALEISGEVMAGELRFSMSYSRGLHRRETIESLASSYASALDGVIEHCLEPESGGVTPSDFPLVSLDASTLETLVGSGRGIEDIFPLSPLQSGMLFHTIAEPESGLYVAQYEYDLEGALQVDRLQEAWGRVLGHFTGLRTSFAWEGLEEMVQVVHREATFEWRVEDWCDLSVQEFEERRAEFLAGDRRRAFDPSQMPLMRHSLFRLEEGLHRYVCTFHQSLFDGWSLPLLFEHLFKAYQFPELPLEPIPPFRDYIAWLQRQDGAAAETFWRRQLQGFKAPTRLKERTTARASRSQSANTDLRFSEPLSRTLVERARQWRMTPSTLLQGVWGLLLSRYAAQRQVLFGITVSGRPTDLPGVEDMLGLFINTLPLRMEVDPQSQVKEWLGRLQDTAVAIRQFEHTPLVKLQRWSEVPGDQPLFETFLTYNNFPAPETLESPQEENEGLVFQPIASAERAGEAMALTIEPGSEFSIVFEYDSSLFEETDLERLKGHWVTLLHATIEAQGECVGSLSMLSAVERHQLEVEWNDTEVKLQDLTVPELFARKVTNQAKAEALVFGAEILNRGQLDERATALAQRLRQVGIAAGDRVALCFEQSPWRVLATLAVWKAGAATVPLDPAWPAERLAFVLADSASKVVLCAEALPAPFDLGETLPLDVEVEIDQVEDSPLLATPLTQPVPQQLAYLIYTSGTTGTPKAVMVEHAQLSNTIEGAAQLLGITSGDVMLQVSSPAFDIALFEVWAPLISGATVHLAKAEELLEMDRLVERLRVATLFHTVPSLLRQLSLALKESGRASELAGLRRIFVGGDTVPPSLLHEVGDLLPDCSLQVLYGPTEGAILATSHGVPQGAVTGQPIGRPLPNVDLRVLDREGRAVPIGVAGELCLGGASVSRGYYGRPGKTAARFVGLAGGRFYRTGDLVRYRAEGVLEFLGRTDHQLKIRGFRIEAGEVEAAVLSHPAVSAAVALAWEGEGEKRLVACLVPREGVDAPTAAMLREHLATRLPSYMIPTTFIVLEDLPLGTTGKVDRVALLAAADGSRPREMEYAPPRNPVEAKLVEVWQDVLGMEQVGIYDNFFDLGGDSILSIQIISRARLVGVDLTPRQIFEEPTIAELAEVAETSQPSEKDDVAEGAPLVTLDEDKLSRFANLLDEVDEEDFDDEEDEEDTFGEDD